MKQRIQRQQITARINEDAFDRLTVMVVYFLKKTGNRNTASQGKILETLLLREDALRYVEQKIFSE